MVKKNWGVSIIPLRGFDGDFPTKGDLTFFIESDFKMEVASSAFSDDPIPAKDSI